MKGVVLGGGEGTRLKPLTDATNKHLLPVGRVPMIFHPIRTLVSAGIDEVLIVTGGKHAGHYIPVLKNGRDLGLKHLEYAYQEKAGGISQALSLAENFADGDDVTVILGDNCTDADIRMDVESFHEGAKIFLKEVPDPERFGVPTFDKNYNLVRIDEKPTVPATNYAVTGVYIFDRSVFDKIKTLSPSSRGELEVTDLINKYIAEGKIDWTTLNGYWRDAGTFETYEEVFLYWAEKNKFAGKERG
jgi:glucose-1-phosphate thymidylyltransferase